MSKILLTFFITLFLMQKGYCTCVTNQTQPPQDIKFKIEPYTSSPKECFFQEIIGPDIASYYANPQPKNSKYCMIPNLPSNQNCTVQITIIGLTKPFDPQHSDCVIEGTPEEIAILNVYAIGAGCSFSSSSASKDEKGNKMVK